ncbi:uncharacterized protein BXIN_2236 [Babesia sp. Xinjiang]|uniref:uncharacterized protein n=1 Tax=Babesia sp. Xinjiang TaxID=462227 RepID=UPI000A2472F9|nr:uncharacterized protein BXIN_2236 [Babesia sp. Xinjiang]ORM40779.1 hypothetical protein BXIN_2236 [Babesia sp. Xinjiang]
MDQTDSREDIARSMSCDIQVRRSTFGIEHLSNLSQHAFPLLPRDDVRYVSFYSDYGRLGRYGKASEDSSIFERIAERMAFYTYFDLDVQKHCKNKYLRLLYGFNFWLKHIWIKPLLHNAIWVVSGIIVTVTWCIVWEWAACYMKREEGNYNLVQWSVESVPELYFTLEGAFQLIFCMNYLIQFYECDIRYKYIFSLNGFIDLTMTPALTQTISFVSSHFDLEQDKYGSIKKFGLLFFGPLRFLKLTQAEELLNKSFDNLSDVHMIIVGIATAALSLLFSFSGMMYLLEAPRKGSNFVTPFDFVYFGVATMGTGQHFRSNCNNRLVGYGDFAPITVMGRLLSILLICTCISLGAVRFKRLKEAITLSDVDMGLRFDLTGYKYVLFWGPLSAYQILTFCRSVVNSFDGAVDTVVVATPLPLESYRVVYGAVRRNTRLNLCILGGSEKICAPSSVYKLIGLSMRTVVVNDMEAESHGEQVENDRMAILRTVACSNIAKILGIPIDVQLYGSEYGPFLSSSNFSRICFIRELKYKLIAKSVTCRGLFYLILTLFHTPTNISRTRVYVEDLYKLFATSSVNSREEGQNDAEHSLHEVAKQLFEIVTGMKFQIYKLDFPPCLHGFTFLEICQHLYKSKNMFLLGLVSTEECILNPIDCIIGHNRDGLQYQGLVLAQSLRDVHHVAILQNPSLDLLPLKMDGTIPGTSLEISHAIPENSGDIMSDDNNHSGSLFYGIYKVDDYKDAVNVFSESRTQLILVCGWLVDMHCFLKSLLADNAANVICLAPMDLVKSSSPLTLSSFRSSVVYIDGSAMDIDTLVNSGVLKATCIVILNSAQCSSGFNGSQLSKDSQVLFVRHLLKHIRITSSLLSTPTHVILDIQHSSCLEYLDPSLVSSMEASCGRHTMNRLWQNFGEFMTSYEMASGTIFVQDMLYGLLAHSYVPSSNSVGYDTIQKILYGNQDSKTSNRICLEDISVESNGTTFKNLFTRYLAVKHKICIGILRTYQDPLIDAELKQLIIVAPQPSFVVQRGDQVYVIQPNIMATMTS